MPVKKSSGKAVTKTSDWRDEMLNQIRALIFEVDPDITVELKWVKATNPTGVPVWSLKGILCTGETYKEVVKLSFPKGASLPDPKKLFNSSLDGNTRRAIDLREGEKIDTKALKALIKAAIAENLNTTTSKAKPAKKTAPLSKPSSDKVVLLSGGNPQIAKADGDAPVQAYIDAMPGWKQRVGKQVDDLIVTILPDVQKAVRWNSPFYGVEGKGWFLNVHCLTKYVKVTFFDGTSLNPIPPGGTPKSKEARWLDIYEADTLDEAQFTSWIKQAAKLPGWKP